MGNKHTDMFNPSLDAVLKELRRELKTRETIYPRWKLEGKLTADVATLRISCIQKAIELLSKHTPPQGSLFGQ